MKLTIPIHNISHSVSYSSTNPFEELFLYTIHGKIIPQRQRRERTQNSFREFQCQ